MANGMMRLPGLFFLAAVTALGAGCCTRDHDTPPMAMTMEEQVAQLNARAAALQTLKAKGRVSIEWRDKKGGHRQTADAILLLGRQPQRTIADALAPAADVRLLGTFSGTEVFEIGVNGRTHWTAFHVDPKKAYVGKVGGTADAGAANGAAQIDPFRADRILEVMGLTTLYPASATQRVTMESHDDTGMNEISIYRAAAPGSREWLQRVELVNRRTGDIDEVRLYHPDGTLEATAVLSDYADIKASDDSGGAHIHLPGRIKVNYPGQEANVDITLASIRLNVELPPDFAVMPDFAEQGLEVVDVDKGEE